jgi:hypothetical protein
VTITADATVGGVLAHATAALGVDDTTPSVSSANVFRTANTTGITISDFDDGVAGQVIYIHFNDTNTTLDCTSSSIKCNGGADWGPSTVGDSAICFAYVATEWYCTITEG